MEISNELYYLLGQQFATMEKMVKAYHQRLKDELVKLNSEIQIDTMIYNKVYSLIANKELIISPTEMHRLLPDFKNLIERDETSDGEELRYYGKCFEALILRSPFIVSKEQEDWWHRGYSDAQIEATYCEGLN